MDGKRGLMSLNSCGSANEFSYGYVDNRNPLISMADGRIKNQHSPQSLSQWIDCPKTPQSYVEFLTENIGKFPTADVLESIGTPIGGTRAIGGTSELQSELMHNNAAGKSISSGPDDYSLESEHAKLKLSAYAMNTSNHEALASERLLRPHDRLHGSRFSSSGFESHAQQNHTFWKQEPNEDDGKVFQLQAKENISAPSFLCQPHQNVLKPRAAGSDRQRKLRIAECIKALQELLPNSTEKCTKTTEGAMEECGHQTTAVDDVIDHVKFLQLLIKGLSGSRLGGEPTCNPLVFFEGYGHYSLHEQTIREPFEEMIGKLLEIDPLAATKLLESKGLYLMPRALVDGLQRAT